MGDFYFWNDLLLLLWFGSLVWMAEMSEKHSGLWKYMNTVQNVNAQKRNQLTQEY